MMGQHDAQEQLSILSDLKTMFQVIIYYDGLMPF